MTPLKFSGLNGGESRFSEWLQTFDPTQIDNNNKLID